MGQVREEQKNERKREEKTMIQLKNTILIVHLVS